MTDKNTFFHQKSSLNIGGRLLDLSRPKVMGILNVTPDSFYDGGRTTSEKQLLLQTGQMLEEGAAILDLGAYSSRPNADHISEQEETFRLIPALKSIVREFPEAVISIDTFRSGLARKAVEQGAHIINDISGGEQDEQMFRTVSELKVPYILMHMKGNPQTMLRESKYENLMDEVFQYFLEKLSSLKALGTTDVILDPGFGFAKTAEQSFELLAKLDQFRMIGLPLLAGLSRKSMICKAINTTAEMALNGTTAANTIALMKGAKILRVHDVKAAVEAVQIFEKTLGAGTLSTAHPY